MMRIIGNLDSVKGGMIEGWAFSPESPNQDVQVTILVNGLDAASARADSYRADLEIAGFGNGRHAFFIPLPKSLLRDGCMVSAVAGEDRVELWNPVRFETPVADERAAEQASEIVAASSLQLYQRLARGLSAWGHLASDMLPAFIDDALAADAAAAAKLRARTGLRQIVADIDSSFPIIELPFLADPVCSIIIPVLNNFEITYHCLKSLHETGAADIAEIILGDDGSDDAVIFLGSIVTNIRVSRNAKNLGFLRNCNRAAKMARGKFLLFLNNDTIAKPDWLQNCLATFEQFAKVGIVGSKLLYEDGVLQDAGGIIWRDGSAWNFGNRDDGRAPEYNYVRDVDYVTGASLAIRRDLFEHFGGFDEAYVPAYCEDSDLCLKLSAAGWRVLYQPFSELIHLEGKSHGQDLNHGIKAYQVANAKKLFTRWRDYISDNGPNADRPWLNKDRRHAGRALVIDLVTPTPERDAGSIATYQQMLILRDLGYKISFIPEDNFAHAGEPTKHLQAAGIECVYGPYIRSVDEWLEKFGDSLDVIHVYRHNVLGKHWDTIKRRAPNAKVIYANADMHFLRLQRQAERAGNRKLAIEAEQIREIELNLHARADYSIVTSDYEMELLNQSVPGAPVKLLRWINAVVERQPARAGRDAIAFLGGYQHTPNVDAVDYFMTEIFPKVIQLVPEIQFLICGSAMPDRFRDYAGPNVEVVGFVRDLAPLFKRCIATVAPVRFGAGFKGKVATSLSHGVPCIGTAIALEGMGLKPGEGIIAAQTPDSFASEIASLFQDQAAWEELARRGIAAVDRLYSRQAAMQSWCEILADLGLPARPPDHRDHRAPAPASSP